MSLENSIVLAVRLATSSPNNFLTTYNAILILEDTPAAVITLPASTYFTFFITLISEKDFSNKLNAALLVVAFLSLRTPE